MQINEDTHLTVVSTTTYYPTGTTIFNGPIAILAFEPGYCPEYLRDYCDEGAIDVDIDTNDDPDQCLTQINDLIKSGHAKKVNPCQLRFMHMHSAMVGRIASGPADDKSNQSEVDKSAEKNDELKDSLEEMEKCAEAMPDTHGHEVVANDLSELIPKWSEERKKRASEALEKNDEPPTKKARQSWDLAMIPPKFVYMAVALARGLNEHYIDLSVAGAAGIKIDDMSDEHYVEFDRLMKMLPMFD